MRGYACRLVLLFLAGTVTSCAPSQGTPTAGPHGPDDKNSCVVMSGGKAILRLTLPPGAQPFDKDGLLTVVDAKGYFRFYLWTVNNAPTIDEAAPRIPEIIKGEFLEFKLTGTKELTVADAAAKQFAGSGKEADDGDPGNAEVVLFTVGSHVFAACIHGEGAPSAVARNFMMAAIQTARAP